MTPTRNVIGATHPLAPYVLLTGVGAVSPIGRDVPELLDALSRGARSIKKPISVVSPTVSDRRLSEVPFEFNSSIPRYIALAQQAAEEALRSSALGPENIDLLVVGTCAGPRPSSDWRLAGLAPPSPTIEGDRAMSEATSVLARNLNIDAPCLTVSTACSSGAAAVAHAWHMVRTGAATTALCIGVDEYWLGLQLSFEMIGALSDEGCSPYDRSDGTTLGEGAAAVVLVADSTGRDSSLISAYVLGVGQSADAYHPVRPDPTGDGPFLATQRAWRMAGQPSRIDLVSGHGTGTRANDQMEARLLDKMRHLTSSKEPPPTFSTKNLHGHMVGASGITELIELIAGLKGEASLTHAAFLNKQHVNDVDELWFGIKNAFSMGGLNTSIVVAAEPPIVEALPPLAAPIIIGVADVLSEGLAAASLTCRQPRSFATPHLQRLMVDHARCRRSRWQNFDTLSTLAATVIAGLLEVTQLDSLVERTDVGLFLSTEVGPARLWRDAARALEHGGQLAPHVIPNLSRHAAASNSAELYGLRGPVSAFYTSGERSVSVLSAALAAVRARAALALFVVEVDEDSTPHETEASGPTTGIVLRGCVVVDSSLVGSPPSGAVTTPRTGLFDATKGLAELCRSVH